MRKFHPSWKVVSVKLGEKTSFVPITLTDSFWKTCPELRGKQITRWIIELGLNRWEKEHPHKLNLEPLGDRKFEISYYID